MGTTTNGGVATVHGVAQLAARYGIAAWRLRREIELLNTSGRVVFLRVSGRWMVREDQLAELVEWLRERGLVRG
jgi:hypothetical protein